MLAEDIIKKPVGVSPHTIAAIISSSCVITAFVVATWVSTNAKIDALFTSQIELKSAITALQTAETSDRYRGKDADRTLSVMRSLNAEKYSDFRIPIPTSVRDGQVEVFK